MRIPHDEEEQNQKGGCFVAVPSSLGLWRACLASARSAIRAGWEPPRPVGSSTYRVLRGPGARGHGEGRTCGSG